MSGPVTICDGDTGRPLKTPQGLMPVLVNGIAGSYSVAVLAATTSAPGSTAVVSSATGFLQFSARPGAALTPGTGAFYTQGVAVAWSTLAGDHAGIATLLAAAVGETDATPTAPPVLVANCALLVLGTDRVTITWNGSERIRTIGARAIGATPAAKNVIIDLVS